MASIKGSSATSALNEDQYINKLYDNVIEKQKNLLSENKNEATSELDALKESVQQQTNTNLGRVNVEAQKLQQTYKAPNVSSGAQQQIALAMDNQTKKNVTTMRTVQSEADAEIDRQRKLLGEQYSAAIKKAQADNDMQRAQLLYEAAKREDEQLLSLKKQAGTKLAALGDNSVLESLLGENPVTRDTTSETWADVLKRESELNKVYDSANESARQEAQMAKNEALATIEAAQAAEMASTDKNLTQAYVNALKRNKSYNEVQGAHGLGSGNLAQMRLMQALGLTEDLTNQRGVFVENTANRGQQKFAGGQAFRDAVADAVANNEQKRAQALYDAAEAEEQSLIDTQQTVGNALAEQGDYSVLGKLYGLTQDQINRLQGTGYYGYYGYTGSGSGYGSGSGDGTEEYNSDGFTPPYESEVSNNPVLALGRGPISNAELGDLLDRGEVEATPSGELVNVDPLTSYPVSSGVDSKIAALTKAVASAANTESNSVSRGGAGGTLSTKVDAVSSAAPKASSQSVASAIKQAVSAPISDPAGEAGKTIGTAIANWIKKAIKK